MSSLEVSLPVFLPFSMRALSFSSFCFASSSGSSGASCSAGLEEPFRLLCLTSAASAAAAFFSISDMAHPP